MVYDIMNDGQRKFYEENLECDFSFAIPEPRALPRQRIRPAARRRRGDADHPVEDPVARGPESAEDFRGDRRPAARHGAGHRADRFGQVDHAGRRWSTTSTRTSYGHILTIEDPIEFVHESKKCLINQREVGPHTLSFANALRSALREDPGRHPGRRDARPRDDPAGDDRRRNGPPGVRHAAHVVRPPRPSTASSTCSRPKKRK